MAISLSTTKEYESILAENKKTRSQLRVVNKDTIDGIEGGVIPNFEGTVINWHTPDTTTINRIISNCNLKTIYDSSYGWFYFVISAIAVGVLTYIYFNLDKIRNLDRLPFYVCYYVVVCLFGYTLCSLLSGIKAQLKKRIREGNYVITAITPLAAKKGVQHGRNTSWDYMTVLYAVDDYLFEDAGLAYLHSNKVNSSDCESKLEYENYNLLKFEIHTLFHKPLTYYAICGI